MQDIRKPYSRSRSSRNLYDKVEQFESRRYQDEEEEPVYDRREDKYDDEPVRIPSRDAPRVRRNINSMDMYPKKSSQPEADEDGDDGMKTFFNKRRVPIDRDPRTRYLKRSSLRTWLFIAGLILLCTIVYLLTYVFNRATITVIPKYQDVEVKKTITVSQTPTEGQIKVIVASSSLSASKQLEKSETKKVEAKASGKIMIYNNFDEEPQRLIKNTRFESNAGRTYRIGESVTVPGKKGDKPGTLEVTVYADSYGAEYNTDPTDFTIPGFKGTPRYTTFFGRSVGPIIGGATGDVSLPSLSDLNAAKDSLELELAPKIKQKLLQVKQDGYTPLYSLVDIIYQDNETDILQGKATVYEIVATGYLMLADTSMLTRNFAQGIRDYNNEEVSLGNEENVTYTKKDGDSLSTSTAIPILAEGTPRIIWTTNEGELKKLFLGKPKTDFGTIMKTVPSVEQGQISFFPLWISTFPKEADKVTIVQNKPKN